MYIILNLIPLQLKQRNLLHMDDVVTEETVEETPLAPYEAYLQALEIKMNEFIAEARRGAPGGVKASALRARKMSLFLGEELPHFRKISKAGELKTFNNSESIAFAAKER